LLSGESNSEARAQASARRPQHEPRLRPLRLQHVGTTGLALLATPRATR